MFFISSVKENLYGVTDTSDNVEEFYTLEQIDYLVRKAKIKIQGVSSSGIKVLNLSSSDMEVINMVEPLEKKILKASFLSHPNDTVAISAYEDICTYIKLKYRNVYKCGDITYNFASDGYCDYMLTVRSDGELVLLEYNKGSDKPNGWYPYDLVKFNTTNKWRDTKYHYKVVRKLIKNWGSVLKYLDSLM